MNSMLMAKIIVTGLLATIVMLLYNIVILREEIMFKEIENAELIGDNEKLKNRVTAEQHINSLSNTLDKMVDLIRDINVED